MAIIAVTEQTYEQQVQQAALPVLVDFWAPWCVHCRRIMPALEALEEQLSGTVQFVKINADEEPELLAKNNVDTLPTLKLFSNGVCKGQLVAPTTKAAIEAFIRSGLEA